jgi:hypothetical protein
MAYKRWLYIVKMLIFLLMVYKSKAENELPSEESGVLQEKWV